ncbi:MAG: deoxyribonuclease IV [bacterium]
MIKNKLLLGAHITISKGLDKAIEIGQSIGCTAIQIFTKNNKSYFAKKLTKTEIENFKKTQKNSTIEKVVAHTSYLINICSKNPETENKSIASLKEELSRCEQLEIPYLVLHPGSHTGQGEKEGIKKIAKNLDMVLNSASGNTMILLETMAGQGTNLGYKFEQLKEIRDLCKHKKLIGFCFDTCHVYSAGYNIGTEKGYKKTIKEFDEILGLKNLKAIHLNDSKTELGSRKDRHANIGNGKIPKLSFQLLMKDKRFKKVPKILETPTDSDLKEYKEELTLLKKWAE